jgi:hypothetical protein
MSLYLRPKVRLESTKSNRRDHVRQDKNYLPLGKSITEINVWFINKMALTKKSPQELAFHLLINNSDLSDVVDEETKMKVKNTKMAEFLKNLGNAEPKHVTNFSRFLLTRLNRDVMCVTRHFLSH